ncbi:MAG: hypothetical protein WAN65_16960 [Candidatus Sulfotelmatobacter sp.]
MNQIWLAISSGVLGGTLGSIAAGIFALRSKRNEYVNDYYKIIIARRIAVYEKVETLIASLRPEVVAPDDPVRPYHMPFAFEDTAKWKSAFLPTAEVLSQGLWLSRELFHETRELSRILFPFNKPESLIEYGRTVYPEVAARRQKIEQQLSETCWNCIKFRDFCGARTDLIPLTINH